MRPNNSPCSFAVFLLLIIASPNSLAIQVLVVIMAKKSKWKLNSSATREILFQRSVVVGLICTQIIGVTFSKFRVE